VKSASPRPARDGIIRSGREGDLGDIVALARTAWPEHGRNHYQNDPWFEWEQFRLAEVGGRIVSMLKVFMREVRWGGSTAMLGGIGDVVTHPDWRRHGLGGALLDDAARFMAERGCEIGLLFTGLHDFYARHGWIPASLKAFRARVSRTYRNLDVPYAYRPFDPARDIEGVACLYENFTGNRPGALVRPTGYWRAQLTWTPEEMSAFQVALHRGRVVAYVRARGWEEHLAIQECVYDRDHSAAVIGLAARAAARASEKGYGEIAAYLPRDNAFVAAMRTLGMDVREGVWRNIMFLPIDLDSLARKKGTSYADANKFLDDLGDFHFWLTDGF